MTLATVSGPHQQVPMPALDLRRMISSLVASEGVIAATDMAVAQRAAGANMSVDIAAGQALVQGDGITNQGQYYAYNDAVVNLTSFTAAHATLPRIDRVCLRVRDAFHGDAANDLAFVVVSGTATAGATLANLTGAAAVPASHLLLANVLVPAAATTITTANIDTTVRARGGAVFPVAYGTSLPASPSDGQEYVLVDSITAPTYQWRFRYNSGSASAYKWEFVGGADLYAEVTATDNIASATYVAIGTAGPSITVPRAGDYDVEIGAHFAVGKAASLARMSYDIGATGAVDLDSIAATSATVAGGQLYDYAAASRLRRKTGLAASTALVSKYLSGDTTAAVYYARYRWMRVRPIRVS